MKKQLRLSDAKAIFLGLKVRKQNGQGKPAYRITQDQIEKLKEFKQESTTESNEYQESLVLSAWSHDGYMMDIDEYCTYYQLPRHDISSYKLVSHTGTPFYNIVFKENIADVSEFDESMLDSIIAKHIKPIAQRKRPNRPNIEMVDRVVYTDVHIGMDTNENGYSLYGGKWDEQEQNRRIEKMADTILVHKMSSVLYLDDLGDYLDGWNSQTSRGGHDLPQNMDNETAFDVGLTLKLTLLDRLVTHYDTIIFNNICNDNHSSSFGYILNSAFKKVAEARYDNVEVVNHRRFINHYFIKDHCFIICHGKDSKALKFGFKPFLDHKHADKIDQYIKAHNIYNLSKHIHFCKGDSHQALFDQATSGDFDYNNYPAFSPSSEWVQTNFKKGRSGFVIEHVDLGSDDIHRSSFWFKWTR
jgi:hypothetical protein